MNSLHPPTPHWRPTGRYPVDAVGVSFVHDEIAALAANPAGSPALVLCCASLVPYDGNEHDPNAVRVVIDGRKVGHLSRGVAAALRVRLKEIFSAPVNTTCDAFISNGLVTADRSYSYTISLDFDLDTVPSVEVLPKYPKPDRRATDPEIIKDPDGCYRATVWLAPNVLSDVDDHLRTRSWTTDHWTTVNYYLDTRQGFGLGHRLLAIPKDRNFEMFGTDEPDVVIESIDAHVARVCLIPTTAPAHAARSRYLSLTSLQWKHRELAKAKEKTDPESSVAHYLRAMDQLHESSLIFGSGVFGTRLTEDSTTKRDSAMVMSIMDKVSLLLCRIGKPDEAQECLEQFLERHPLFVRSEKTEVIRRRIGKELKWRKSAKSR